MKTHSLLNQQDWYYEVCVDSKFPGEWVKRTDAEAEIEKVRKDGYFEGRQRTLMEFTEHISGGCHTAVQREREAIIEELQDAKFETVEPWLANRTAREVFMSIVNRIRGRGEGNPLRDGYREAVSAPVCPPEKPAKIARLNEEDMSGWVDWHFRHLGQKINELIEAENARRENDKR